MEANTEQVTAYYRVTPADESVTRWHGVCSAKFDWIRCVFFASAVMSRVEFCLFMIGS